MEQDVKVTKISFLGKKKDVFGFGKTRLTKHGFEFCGEVGGEKLNFSYTLDNLQALPFSVGKEYECYYNNELYYFYPENGATCTKFVLLYDLLQEDSDIKKMLEEENAKNEG